MPLIVMFVNSGKFASCLVKSLSRFRDIFQDVFRKADISTGALKGYQTSIAYFISQQTICSFIYLGKEVAGLFEFENWWTRFSWTTSTLRRSLSHCCIDSDPIAITALPGKCIFRDQENYHKNSRRREKLTSSTKLRAKIRKITTQKNDTNILAITWLFKKLATMFCVIKFTQNPQTKYYLPHPQIIIHMKDSATYGPIWVIYLTTLKPGIQISKKEFETNNWSKNQ